MCITKKVQRKRPVMAIKNFFQIPDIGILYEYYVMAYKKLARSKQDNVFVFIAPQR